MIDYDVLCQAIDDWKAGRAPTPVATRDAGPPSPPAPPAQEVAGLDELDELQDEDALDDLQEVVEEPQEQTIIYQLPIEPLDEDDL